MSDQLPILDVSWRDTYRATPDNPFAALNQRTDEEDARLQKLLGIPSLAKEWPEHAHAQRGKVLVFGRLVPVGQTTEGEIIAVALQLATTKGYSTEHGWRLFARQRTTTISSRPSRLNSPSTATTLKTYCVEGKEGINRHSARLETAGASRVTAAGLRFRS